MKARTIKIDSTEIVDWTTFHEVFQRKLGFPHFYGGNMNAWIDCLFSIDDPDAGMTEIVVASDELAVLEITGVKALRDRCPEQYAALVECSAFVNYSRIEAGKRSVLSLMLSD